MPETINPRTRKNRHTNVAFSSSRFFTIAVPSSLHKEYKPNRRRTTTTTTVTYYRPQSKHKIFQVSLSYSQQPRKNALLLWLLILLFFVFNSLHFACELNHMATSHSHSLPLSAYHAFQILILKRPNTNTARIASINPVIDRTLRGVVG